jgi:hypothetical protein
MSNTTTLPTDRKGNVYYGPSTSTEAIKQIEAERESACEYSDDSFSLASEVERVAQMMERAGYAGAAARVRNHYR